MEKKNTEKSKVNDLIFIDEIEFMNSVDFFLKKRNWPISQAIEAAKTIWLSRSIKDGLDNISTEIGDYTVSIIDSTLSHQWSH